jgi:hypothetical protein
MEFSFSFSKQFSLLNYWVMHPVARVSINIYIEINFHFSYRRVGLTKLSNQWVTGTLSPGVKRQRREANNAPRTTSSRRSA